VEATLHTLLLKTELPGVEPFARGKVRDLYALGDRLLIVASDRISAFDVVLLSWIPDKGVRSLIESDGQTRVWTRILRLAPGTYQYRYVVDGEWQEDPENPEAVTSAVGGRNSVLVVS